MYLFVCLMIELLLAILLLEKRLIELETGIYIKYILYALLKNMLLGRRRSSQIAIIKIKFCIQNDKW